MNPFRPFSDMLQQFLSGQPLDRTNLEFDEFILHVIGTGIIELEPKGDHELDLVISAGVHGNETAPIEVVNNLISDILQNKVSVKNRVLFILGNQQSMKQATRFVEHNMNRLFNGNHKKPGLKPGYEIDRAAKLERSIDQFFSLSTTSQKLHLDLHTAIRGSFRERFAIYPYSDKRSLSNHGLEVLAACNVNTVLIMETSGPTFSSHSGLHWGAQSFTVELGQVAPFGQNDLPHYSDVKQTLENLVSGKSLTSDPAAVDQFRVSQEILHTGSEFEINISESGFNFTNFGPGNWVWKDKDSVFNVKEKTQYLVFPNTKVAKGERAGLLVEKIES